MVGSVHAGKGRHRHVAGDALVSFTSCLVMGMGRGILNPFRMTGHAGVVRLFLGLEAVPATARVARDTVELARLEAWAHEPRGIGVILPEVAAIGVKVMVLKGDEVIVVEEFFTRRERRRQGNHPGVAGRTGGVMLVRCESFGTYDF
jgi:hypothetical protein